MGASIGLAQTTPLRPITLQLKWKHQFQFAGYYAAVAQGYYRDAGLEVTLREATDGSGWPGDAVFEGIAEFGTATTELLLERERGRKPVIVAPIFQHSAYRIIALKESGIETAEDLIGKTVMIDQRAPDILNYLRSENVRMDQLQQRAYDFDIEKLINGEIDAVSGYLTDAPFPLNQRDLDYVMLSPESSGIDFYGDLLFTSQRLIEEEPELVVAFREASLKGWQYAMENPLEVTLLIRDEYSKRHPRPHLRFESRKMVNLIDADVIEIGYSNRERWDQIVASYIENGFLSADFDIEPMLLESYVDLSRELPWRLIGFLAIVTVIVALVAAFFHRSAWKLKKEVEKRARIESKLRDNELRLREANEVKDKFFSIIAHDLRSPFNSMLGMSKLLLKQPKNGQNDALDDQLNLIHDTAENTLALLTNLLDWSASQVGQLEFSPESLNLTQLVRANIDLVKSQASAKRIAIQFEATAPTPIEADRNMLNTIIRNLIYNAVKFTNPDGAIAISIENLENQYSLKVSDNGVGMSDQTLKSLFKPNRVQSSSGTAQEQGTGLGLLLCQEFVTQHSGEIEVESELDLGTTFTILLPKRVSLSPAAT